MVVRNGVVLQYWLVKQVCCRACIPSGALAFFRQRSGHLRLNKARTSDQNVGKLTNLFRKPVLEDHPPFLSILVNACSSDVLHTYVNRFILSAAGRF